MSPEQVRGKELDARSDLFSFGSVLYEMATGTLPFRGESPGVVFKSILDTTPAPATRLNPDLPARLQEVIEKSLEKDRSLRYQHASEIRSDLQRIQRDLQSPSSVSLPATAPSPSRRSRPMLLGWISAIATLVLLFTYFAMRKVGGLNSAPGESPSQAVAVLPFQNMSADSTVDFLRLALPDEIATALSYVHSLSIRPFETTSRYAASSLDVERAGREMHVNQIVTGHYLKEGDQLQITLEAIDVAKNRTIWQETLHLAAADLITMRGQVDARVRQGLVPSLGASGEASESQSHPRNEEAYDLYLRSLALPRTRNGTKQAIGMLERAVGLDGNYAPAYAALGERYYYDARYSDGGQEMFNRSISALSRASGLDPNYTLANARLITNWVEAGELQKAYAESKALVARQPRAAMAHFALSYVLRYGGLLDESAHECDLAFAIDPGDYQLRSCAFAFQQLGKTDRAFDFLRADEGSEWVLTNIPMIYLRQGKLAEAHEHARFTNGEDENPMLIRACLANPPDAQQQIAKAISLALGDPDPEMSYGSSTVLANCGRPADAVRLAGNAITKGYCAYTALQQDPALAPIRSRPEYPQLLSQAKECRARFVAGHASVSP
jgi:TolB-like protein